jgi:hypothetical protein
VFAIAGDDVSYGVCEVLNISPVGEALVVSVVVVVTGSCGGLVDVDDDVDVIVDDTVDINGVVVDVVDDIVDAVVDVVVGDVDDVVVDVVDGVVDVVVGIVVVIILSGGSGLELQEAFSR